MNIPKMGCKYLPLLLRHSSMCPIMKDISSPSLVRWLLSPDLPKVLRDLFFSCMSIIGQVRHTSQRRDITHPTFLVKTVTLESLDTLSTESGNPCRNNHYHIPYWYSPNSYLQHCGACFHPLLFKDSLPIVRETATKFFIKNRYIYVIMSSAHSVASSHEMLLNITLHNCVSIGPSFNVSTNYGNLHQAMT